MPIPALSALETWMLKDGMRIAAVDYGKARIGVAISDGLRKMAHPQRIIQEKNFTKASQALFSLLDEYACTYLVVGLPLHMDGSSSPMSQSATQFARNLLKIRPDLTIILEDERLSSAEAQQQQQSKGSIDASAAAIILQQVLDRL